MSLGLIDVGTYVPASRVARAAIGEAWAMEQAMSLLVGERAVAGYDEDTLTMAVEAAQHALMGRDPSLVDALFFASTTPPFGEKSSAAVIAAACDLPASRTLDVTTSLRAGTSALALAVDTVRAGAARRALIAVADARQPEPGTLLEAISGDGAAALLLGSGDEVIAELLGSYHLSDPTLDVWRRSADRTLHTDDEPFTQQVGYFDLVGRAVAGLLRETGLDPEGVAGVAAYAPDARAYGTLAKRSPLGAALARMGAAGPAPRLLRAAGNLGAAFAPAQLALLLEAARPGDVLVLVGYGDGADAFAFRVTEAIARRPAKRPTRAWLDTGVPLPYPQALFFREQLRDRALFPAGSAPWTSLPLLYRERDALLRRHAQRCGRCGALWWPARPACYECGAREGFTHERLGGRGTVASFVVEWAIPSPAPPVGMVTVDTPEGARLTTPSTDGDPRALAIGDEVEFAFRLFHTAKGLPHYGWKVRKVRRTKYEE